MVDPPTGILLMTVASGVAYTSLRILPDTPADHLPRLVEHVHLATERTSVANP